MAGIGGGPRDPGSHLESWAYKVFCRLIYPSTLPEISTYQKSFFAVLNPTQESPALLADWKSYWCSSWACSWEPYVGRQGWKPGSSRAGEGKKWELALGPAFANLMQIHLPRLFTLNKPVFLHLSLSKIRGANKTSCLGGVLGEL